MSKNNKWYLNNRETFNFYIHQYYLSTAYCIATVTSIFPVLKFNKKILFYFFSSGCLLNHLKYSLFIDLFVFRSDTCSMHLSGDVVVINFTFNCKNHQPVRNILVILKFKKHFSRRISIVLNFITLYQWLTESCKMCWF